MAFLCLEIDECAKGLDDCGSLAKCVDTLQGFNCVCIHGYSGDGYSCVGVLIFHSYIMYILCKLFVPGDFSFNCCGLGNDPSLFTYI